MYNVKVDENYFYQGAYAKVGKIQNGEDIHCLPPSENQLCYYINFKEEIEIEQVPVKVYIKNIVSDTEFDVYYEHKTTNEEGDGVLINITEEEYNALSAEEKENVIISEFPKVIRVELSKDEYESLSDEEKQKINIFSKTDEEGNLLYEDVEKTIIVKEWVFSQEKYDELEAKRIEKEEEQKNQDAYNESISNETLKAENERLTEMVDMLTACVLEMSEMVYA